MSEGWPPALKEWVAKCLGQMTASNSEEAKNELKQVIFEAKENKTLWTTDWQGVQLQSLLPRPPPSYVFKRKIDDKLQSNKKKKAANGSKANSSYSSSSDFSDQAALNRRAQRFQREHDLEKQKARGGQETQVTPGHSNLLHRIHSSSRSGSPSVWSSDAADAGDRVMDWDQFTIVGTSHQIFKDYLRLTTEPDQKDIRPLKVLEKTLVELKKRWRQNNDYPWICNQFKSIRQDLTVQRIRTEFTVQVYEIHARMALEAADMVEYNQCQAMLKTLYEHENVPGCNDEFTAYRILALLHGMNRSDLNLLVGQLTGKQKSSQAIKHALEVQRALSANNYHAFFEFYTNAPNMGAYIMDHFVDRERTKALMIMSKAYPNLPLSFIRDELAFESCHQVAKFLDDHKAPFYKNPNDPDDQKIFECKSAQTPLSQVYDEKYRKAKLKGAI